MSLCLAASSDHRSAIVVAASIDFLCLALACYLLEYPAHRRLRICCKTLALACCLAAVPVQTQLQLGRDDAFDDRVIELVMMLN